MCGLAAEFAYRDGAARASRERLERASAAMASRGPDGANLWISADGRAGFAHRRLALIDLSEAGAQPMATPDGKIRIAFNGEIHFPNLRGTWRRKGYRFRSPQRYRSFMPTSTRNTVASGAPTARNVRVRCGTRKRSAQCFSLAIPGHRRFTTPTMALACAWRLRLKRCDLATMPIRVRTRWICGLLPLGACAGTVDFVQGNPRLPLDLPCWCNRTAAWTNRRSISTLLRNSPRSKHLASQ